MLNNRLNKNRIILLVVALVSIISIIALLLVVFIPKTDKIVYEIHYEGVSGEGIVFRNERFVDLSDYEKISYNNIIDGQFVSAGTNIASAYKKGYIKTTLEKLTETEKNIVTYQNQNIITEFDDKTIRNYDFEIEVIIKKMSEENSGNIELYGELCNLMRKRQEYIRGAFNTENNNYLQGLYTDEITLTESLQNWCDVFCATDDCFIGFYCDGYEREFNFEKANNISYKEISNLLKKEYNADLNGFKLINDGKWYIAVTVDDSSLFSVGSCYPVYLNNEKESEAGLLEKIVEDKNECILVFSFEENVEKYINVRKTNIFVGQRFEGFCLDADFVENNEVTVKNNKEKYSIPVNVTFKNERMVIFDITDQLEVGQKVYK